jgi:hypothetical protein
MNRRLLILVHGMAVFVLETVKSAEFTVASTLIWANIVRSYPCFWQILINLLIVII